VHAAAPHLLVAGAALDAVGADHPQQRLLGVAQRLELWRRQPPRVTPEQRVHLPQGLTVRPDLQVP